MIIHFSLMALSLLSMSVTRQAKVSFAVTKSSIEKKSDGGFELKQDLICQRAFLIDVVDTADGSKPEFQFAAQNCPVELDEKAGLGTYSAEVLLGASLEDNTKSHRKTYTPIAILKVGGKNILMTNILESPSGDMKDIYFNLPEGSQDFYKSQKVTVGVRLEDNL